MRKFVAYFVSFIPFWIMAGIMIYNDWEGFVLSFVGLLGFLDILGWIGWFFMLGQKILDGDKS